MAGIGLGIIATIDKPNATGEFVLDGSPLHGDSLSNHAFLVASGANVPKLSLGSLVNAAEKFRNAMNDFGDDVIDSLVSLEERLESAVEKVLGIPVTPGDGPTVELMPDNTPGRRALRVEIDYNPTYTKQHNLNLDLDALGVPAIGNLVDARGSAMFSVTAGANVNLDVGLDLTNPANPRPFLYNTTTAALGAKIYGSGIHFKAALGPLGIAIGNGGNNNGFLVLDSDGLLEPNANSNDRAGLTVGITGGDANGRVYFESLTPSNLSTPAVDGQMNLRLPVYKTDKTTVLDAAGRHRFARQSGIALDSCRSLFHG